MTLTATTCDRWYDGTLWLTQPATGFRATSDAVMLAAAIPHTARHVLELGVGAGAVMMIMARRLTTAQFTGIDHNPDMIQLCAQNAADNGFSERINLLCSDIMTTKLTPDWDHVVMNPPFNDPASTLSPERQRRQSMAADFAASWVACASMALSKRGGLTMICRADQLDRILAALTQHDFGECVIRPVYSRPDRPAHRVLIRARKGMAGAMTILPGLIMESDEYHGIIGGGALVLVQPGRKYAAAAKL